MATRRRRPADRGNSAAAPGRPWQLGRPWQHGGEGRCATHALTSEGRCATHTHTQTPARPAMQHTHSQARAAVSTQHTHAHKARAAVQDTNAHKRGPLGRCAGHKCSQARDAVQHTRTQSEGRCNTLYRYIYSHSGPIYIASRGCCRGHVCFMRLGCCWGRFRFPFLYKNIRLFIKTYARVYVSAARAAIFLSKVRLLVPS